MYVCCRICAHSAANQSNIRNDSPGPNIAEQADIRRAAANKEAGDRIATPVEGPREWSGRVPEGKETSALMPGLSNRCVDVLTQDMVIRKIFLYLLQFVN